MKDTILGLNSYTKILKKLGKPSDFMCLHRFRYLVHDDGCLLLRDIVRIVYLYEDFGYGRVAQLVEQVTFNHWVTGSNPVALTIVLT